MATSVKSIAHFRDSNRLVVRSLDTASLQRSVIEMSSLGFWESGAEPGGLWTGQRDPLKCDRSPSLADVDHGRHPTFAAFSVMHI